jgi:hypothetical protein
MFDCSKNTYKKLTITLFNGVEISGYIGKSSKDSAFLPRAFQACLKEKFGIPEHESLAMIIADDPAKMKMFLERTPWAWKRLAKIGAKKVRWKELPKVFDSN